MKTNNRDSQSRITKSGYRPGKIKKRGVLYSSGVFFNTKLSSVKMFKILTISVALCLWVCLAKGEEASVDGPLVQDFRGFDDSILYDIDWTEEQEFVSILQTKNRLCCCD